MKITVYGTWADVLRVARLTQNKEDTGKEPSQEWVRKLIKSRHSPLRIRQYLIEKDMTQWVTGHFVRHVHAQPFVGTSRTDLTGLPRDPFKKVKFALLVNAEEVLNISEKRLCSKASEETREEWKEILNGIKEIDPEVVKMCHPRCVITGHCTEFKLCNFYNSFDYNESFLLYRGI